MNTTHTPTTWRDFAEQLTPAQVDDLAEQEAQRREDVEKHGANAEAYRVWLIGEALDHIATNQRDADLNSRISPPANVTSFGAWDSTDAATGRLTRSLQWASFDAGRVAVDLDGWQDDTGAVTGPVISCYGLGEGHPLTAEDARQVARALMAAAETLERLDEDSPPFM